MVWLGQQVGRILLSGYCVYYVYRLPRTHGTWSATHTKAAWHDHAVDHHLPGRYFMVIGRFIFISNCNSGTACRICGLLLVLQRFSTGNLDLFLRDFLLPWYQMLDVHYSRNPKEISDLCAS